MTKNNIIRKFGECSTWNIKSKMKIKQKEITGYDVIVIGAGHAGCEAAISSSRIGAKTLLISINMDSIAHMPCNSAIGGPGRGQLVREIDVLGGEMAKNVDRNFIHMRMLNTSKGPSVRALRAIVDKRRYFLNMKKVIENQKNLEIRQGLVTGIEKNKEYYFILTSDSAIYSCKNIVICTGTFLNANIFWGNNNIEAGRHGEISSKKLGLSLVKMGFKFARLKTDTPPRVDKKTINFDRLKVQMYDENPDLFSYDSCYNGTKQVKVYITYAEKECIDYIKRNIKKSTAYGHEINSKGPKYCPSIEDKVVRFAERQRHLVFIQPEGKDTNEMYLHGLSTTFPEEIQDKMVRKIKGLENAVITRPGYGVEYDYLLPFQIKADLESKIHKGIFFAGQINGTTGYEEAAAQGILAGINAARKSKNLNTIIIKRQDGYIGVLIDDLLVKGVSEPYRMLTSRNEYRILHRHDNADIRLVKYLKDMGYKKKAEKILKKYEKIEQAIKDIKLNKTYKNKRLWEKIKQGSLAENERIILKKNLNLNKSELDIVVVNIKYEQYIKREINNIEKLKENVDVKIPEDIDYRKVKNISNEALISLSGKRPYNLEQASRLEGVNPSDVFSLYYYIKIVSRGT